MNQDSTTPVTEADETAPADAANDAAEVKAAYTPEVPVSNASNKINTILLYFFMSVL